MKKYEVLLNCFSGFFESIHSEAFDSEEESIIENYPGHKWDDFKFTNDEVGYCKSYVAAISSEVGLKMEFMELTSPREYNFSTDKISVWITNKELKVISSVLNSETLKNLIKRRFTSRDGFSSWYSNDIEEWKVKKVQDWNCVELGTLLDAWIIDFESKDYYDDLDYLGYEYCSGNGQYVDYEILWDVEAEMLIEQQKTLELSKLEAWKTAVNSWKE
jgi:hypothetical protein